MKKIVSVLLATAIMTAFAASSTGCMLSKPDVDGEYVAELDLTPIMKSAFETSLGDQGIDIDVDDFKGEVTVLYELELDDGEYTLTIDYDSYVDSYTDYVMDNLVPVLKEEILDQIEMYGYTEDEFLSEMGYSSMDEYCEESVLASIDTFAEDLENETVEGDYRVTAGFGAAKTSVKLDNDTVLYFEDGNLVGYIDEDLVDDIRDAEDLDDLKDAFEDADADSSLIDVLDMCDSYGISAEDFVSWLDDCGLLDDGLVYEAQ